jgi:hypothetical protein
VTVGALWLLCAAVLLDLVASVALRTTDQPASRLVVVSLLYGLFAGLVALSAWRVGRGRGKCIAPASVLALCGFVGLVTVVAARSGGYHPPTAVWVTHALLCASTLAALVATAALVIVG